ncbi:hypothetical protein HLV40_06485 [Chromohalobacter salexigens]|nr:hypothetical protein [Chromohalobacter salexigens]
MHEKHKTCILDINTISTSRGKSPASENYVDEAEGYALVVKSGSNISKQGGLITEGADWIEKAVYDSFVEQAEKLNFNLNIVKPLDVLLSSTGDGTLGKCCVYDADHPAIADGHVTIIRVDRSVVDPYYLCDYLRAGFGAVQINRLFTGSTGMIELTPDQVNSIAVDLRSGLDEQRALSKKIRGLEKEYLDTLSKADGINLQALSVFKDL